MAQIGKFDPKDLKPSIDINGDHGVPDAMPVLLDCPEHGGNRWAAAGADGTFVCSDCEPNRPRLTAADLKQK